MPVRSAWATLCKWLIFWTLVAVGLFGGRWLIRLFYPLHFRQTVTHYAARFKLDPLLVQAMIRVESRYNPRAVSSKGALGLMQLMPETARWVSNRGGESPPSETELFDPDVNIRLGTAYLRELVDEFDGRFVVALAAYNAGRGNVRKWLDTKTWNGSPEMISSIPFPETRRYVERILATWGWYRRLYRPGSRNLYAIRNSARPAVCTALAGLFLFF